MFDDRIGNLQKMLARMGPEGRQKYAADHADDPIAVSMALFVNNIAKEIKEGKRGEPDMPPPVVQQAIQSMNQPKMPPQGPPQQGPPQGGPQQGPPQGMPPQGMPLQGQPQAPQAMPQQGPQAPQAMPPQMAADGGYMDSRLPEEMGIGALPERSLSNMADGGIVGFNEGGDVQRFQVGGSAKERLPGESFAAFRARMFQLELKNAQERNEAEEPAREAERQRRVAQMQAERGGEIIPSSPFRDPAAPLAFAPPPSAAPPVGPPAAAPNATPSVATMPTDATRRGDARFPVAGPVAGAGPAAPPADAAPPTAAVRSTAGAPTGAPPAAATGIQTLLTPPDLTPEAIAKARADFTKAQPAAVDTLKAERQALVDQKNTNAAAEYTSFKERMAKQGDPYAKQEERANKQEASVAESAERNPYLALMEAGFAMMAGDSPYAMVNLGKGALAGTKTYRDGLALIEKAKEKLTETRDRIDGLRLIRSDLNASEERDIQRETRRTALEGKTIMFNALEKLTGESKAQIESNVQLYLNAQEKGKDRGLQAGIAQLQERSAAADRRSRETVAANALSALPPEARLAKLLGNGDLETGLRKLQEISADKSGAVYAQMFAKEVADARKELREPPSATEYAASIRSFLSVFKPTVVDDSKVKGSPTVYPRPSP